MKGKKSSIFHSNIIFLEFVCPHNLDSCFPFISLSTNFRKQGQICENMVRVLNYSWKFSWMPLKVLLVISYSVVVCDGQNGQKKTSYNMSPWNCKSKTFPLSSARSDDANLVFFLFRDCGFHTIRTIRLHTLPFRREAYTLKLQVHQSWSFKTLLISALITFSNFSWEILGKFWNGANLSEDCL